MEGSRSYVGHEASGFEDNVARKEQNSNRWCMPSEPLEARGCGKDTDALALAARIKPEVCRSTCLGVNSHLFPILSSYLAERPTSNGLVLYSTRRLPGHGFPGPRGLPLVSKIPSVCFLVALLRMYPCLHRYVLVNR